MSNLTEGQLHCSPIRVRSKLGLDDLVKGLRDQRYAGDVPDTGWGSVMDDVDDFRNPSQHRPEIQSPSISVATEVLPRRLKARYYYDAVDVKAKRILASREETADPRSVHVFTAVDLVIAETSESNVYEGVFTTRSEKEIGRYVSDGIRGSLAEIDSSATVQMDSVDFAVSSDFFLWLVHRYDGDQQLDASINLEIIRSLYSEDGLARPVNLAAGAQMDRAELAAAVLQESGKLGPAQFAVYDSDADLTLELELHPDGSFQIIIGQCFYDENHPRAVKGMMLVDDAIYRILPRITSAYSSDSTWPTPGYADLMDKARRVLTRHAAQP